MREKSGFLSHPSMPIIDNSNFHLILQPTFKNKNTVLIPHYMIYIFISFNLYLFTPHKRKTKMKAINMSSPSHPPTPIFMDQPSSSSSSSLHLAAAPLVLGGSSGGGGGTRAIDRHNPIITDERRIGRTPPNSSHPSPFTPKPSPLHQVKTPQTPKTPKNKASVISASNARKLIGLTKIKTSYDHHHIHAFRKGPSTPSDLITIKDAGDGDGGKARADHMSLPESSRYLLNENEESFLDTLSDFDPVLKLEASIEQPETSPSLASHEVATPPKLEEDCKAFTKPPIPPPPTATTTKSSATSPQVVVLRVSLHCRGCEGKVRKHISRMQGVTSFNIDFAAKKVTVVGDITPLEVIASISKVKTAQVWMPTTSGPRPTEVGTKRL